MPTYESREIDRRARAPPHLQLSASMVLDSLVVAVRVVMVAGIVNQLLEN
jgi:hypothetical protein